MAADQRKASRPTVAQASVPAAAGRDSLLAAMPDLPFYTYRRRLPHWRLSGSTYFVTWRLQRGQADLTPTERELVVSAIKHFEHERYELTAFVDHERPCPRLGNTFG